MRFRSDVQGLRCVAVLPVLLFHFGVSLVPGGFTGVDIFFTISGFVIAASIVHDIDERRFSVANFYFKRIRRVFPALAVVLAATTAAAALLLLPDDLTSYGWSLLSAGTFWSNVYFWKATGYFEVVAQNRPLLHTWSLSVEEQFYVVAPIAFWLIHRYGGRRWLTFLMPVAIASLALGIWSALYAPTAGFFVLPTRAWELLTGAMLGLAARPAPADARVREGMAWLGAALVGYGLFALHEGDPFPGWNALFPCVGTALVIHAGTRAERLPTVGRWLSTAPVLWIGDLSYSLYLVHWPIAALTRYRALTPPTAPVVVVMMLGSIGLAALIWRFVEQPFRRIGPQHLRAVLAGGVAMIAGIAGIAAVGIAAKGFPARYPGYVRQTAPVGEGWGDGRCFTSDGTHPLAFDAAACTRIHGRHGRILLWGDSFAAQFTPGIVANARLIDADVLQYTFAGCPPILAYDAYARIGCAPSNRAVLDVIRREHVDTVIVAGRWSGTPGRFVRRLGETLATLRGMGVHVIVFGEAPEFITDVHQLDYLSGNHRDPAIGRWPVAFDLRLNDDVARQARAAGVAFADPTAALCGTGGVCTYRRGTTWFYSDDGHLSPVGSAIAVRRLWPAVAAIR